MEEEIIQDELYENPVQLEEEENQSEEPLDMVEEETTEENSATEPIIVETKGKWQPFEVLAKTEFEVGKTYKLDFAGVCEVAISKDKPTVGLKTNEITFTKDDTNRLWIKTGG